MKQYEIPTIQTACVLTAPGEFETQKDVSVPVPGEGEVLCKIGAVAICGSDPEIIHGGLAGEWPPAYPFIAGHEWAGTVVALGENVTEFRIGDRVAGEAHKGCGYCENCKQGRYTICNNYGKPETGHRHYGFLQNGAYCQYEVYSVKSICKMPDNVTFEMASMCDTTGVALHGLELSGITPGGTVAIIGPGPIGLSAMFLAKALGAAKVIMVGRRSRLAAAGMLGADALVDFEKEDPIAAVRKLTGDRGVDQVFECSGQKGTIAQGIRMAKKGGTVVMLGVSKADVVEEIPFKYTTHNEIRVQGSRANPNTSAKVLALMASGQLPCDKLVSHTFPLERFAEALDTFENRKDNAVKVVILPNGKEEAHA